LGWAAVPATFSLLGDHFPMQRGARGMIGFVAYGFLYWARCPRLLFPAPDLWRWASLAWRRSMGGDDRLAIWYGVKTPRGDAEPNWPLIKYAMKTFTVTE